MRTLVALLLLSTAVGGLMATRGGQQPVADDRQRILEAARAVMAAAGSCALITLDAGGVPRARAMDPFPPEADLTVWMATNAKTRKVAELQLDSRATLYYFDKEGGGYVTLIGEVRLVTDAGEKARLWKPQWQAFYHDANRGDDYLLIEFVPLRLEMVSLAHDIAAAPMGWKPAVLDLR